MSAHGFKLTELTCDKIDRVKRNPSFAKASILINIVTIKYFILIYA